MGRQAFSGVAGNAEVLARLHDTATGLAIGIGLLKGGSDPGHAQVDLARTRQVLEDSLAQLRRLSASLEHGERSKERALGLAESLVAEADRLGVSVQLELAGDDAWLVRQQVALLELAGREAIRNVRRPSGTHQFRKGLELGPMPFSQRL